MIKIAFVLSLIVLLLIPHVAWAHPEDDPDEMEEPSILVLLEGQLRAATLAPSVLLTVFATAVLMGALHALSPGHGKTVVAAYLVGSQGKAYHAIALGGIVTLTHTGSVLALGLVMLAASRYTVPKGAFPTLQLASELLVASLGIGLLVPRLRGWRTEQQRCCRERMRQPVARQEGPNGRTRLVLNVPIQESGPPHSHDPSTMGSIPRRVPPASPLSSIRWRSLLTLGVSGGLIPCPDAIALLLVAVTIHRIALGLSMILCFSLGLAAILILIGLTVLQGKRLFARLRWFDRIAYAMPVMSASVLVALGLGLALRAIGR